MIRLLGLSLLLALFSIPAVAQDTTAPPGPITPPAQGGVPAEAPGTSTLPASPTPSETPSVSKTEVSFGYMLHRFYEPGSNTLIMNGWYADVEHNVIQRWLGAELQASGGYGDRSDVGFLSIYTLMAGPVFYPVGHHKVTLFGDVLAGGGAYRSSIAAYNSFPAKVYYHESFAWTGAAGLDLKVGKHAAVRLVEGDYTQTKFLGGVVHESDVRISGGFIYHFGGR